MNIGNKVLRYVIPFKTNISFDEAIRNISNYVDNANPRFVKESYLDVSRIRYDKLPNNKYNKIITRGSKICNEYKWDKCLPNPLNKEGKPIESDIYDYLKKEFIFDEDSNIENKIGLSWVLKPNFDTKGYSVDTLFSKMAIMPTGMNELKSFSITNLGLYLFKNNLGFLWYEVDCYTDNSDELLRFQYALREINHTKTFIKVNSNDELYIELKEKLEDKTGEHYIYFRLADLFDQLLVKTLGVNNNEIKYLASRDNSYLKKFSIGQYEKLKDCIVSKSDKFTNTFEKDGSLDLNGSKKVCDKPILYTYISSEVNEKIDDTFIDEEKRDLAFHICNGYKESYFYSDKIGTNMYQPFANILWAAGNEGCAIMAWGYGSKDEDKYIESYNYKFYNGFFLEKIRGDYFHLFIRNLYQSYSLLMFSERIQYDLSGNRKDYYDDEEQIGDKNIVENRKEIEILSTDINLFLTKNITTSVSHIKHQNDFYNFLTKAYRIDEESEYIIKGLEALNELSIKQDEMKEEILKSRQESALGIISFVGSLGALSEWENFAVNLWKPLDIMVRIVLIICLIYGFIITIKPIIDIEKYIVIIFNKIFNKKNNEKR